MTIEEIRAQIKRQMQALTASIDTLSAAKVYNTPERVEEWREEAMTARQKQFLNRGRIAYKPGITKGEASDLIEKRMAEMDGRNQKQEADFSDGG